MKRSEIILIKMIKIEISRAFNNTLFWIALLIGCAISVSHIITSVVPMLQYMDNIVQIGRFPHSVFTKVLGSEGMSLETVLFYYILPIIAVIPFADSFYTDRKSGYIKNVFIRTKKTNYFVGKYIAVFLSAGVVVCIPLLLNVFFTAAILPSAMPVPELQGLFPIFNFRMWSGIYYSNPYLYIFLYIMLDAVFAGVLALISLSATYFVSNRFMVLLTPFIIYILLHTIATLTRTSNIDLMMMLQADQLGVFTFVDLLVLLLILLLPFMIFYFYKGRRYETY